MNNCPICCKSTALYHTSKRTSFFKCENCLCIIKNRNYLLTEKKEHERYDYHENSITDLKYVQTFSQLINESLDPYLKNNPTILDYGCGKIPVLAQILNDKYNTNTILYDYYYHKNLDYQKNNYDVIVSTEVFEHLKDPIESLKILVTLLKKGGLIIIMTKFHLDQIDHFKSWFYIRDQTHVTFYNIKTFEIIADQFNLKLIYTNNTNLVTFKKN